MPIASTLHFAWLHHSKYDCVSPASSADGLFLWPDLSDMGKMVQFM